MTIWDWAQGLVEVTGDFDAVGEAFCGLRQELFGAAEDDLCAQAREQHRVGAGYAGVEDVSGDGDGDAGEGFCVDGGGVEAEAEEDGAEIEQRLRGVLGHAVAGVEDGQAGGVGEDEGRSGGGMAEDNALGAEGSEGEAGVLEGFALFDGGGLVGDEGGGGAEGFGGEFEGGAGAGGGFVEEESDAAVDEELRFFGGGGAVEAIGEGEDVGDFGDGEAVDGEEGAGMVGGFGHSLALGDGVRQHGRRTL